MQPTVIDDFPEPPQIPPSPPMVPTPPSKSPDLSISIVADSVGAASDLPPAPPSPPPAPKLPQRSHSITRLDQINQDYKDFQEEIRDYRSPTPPPIPRTPSPLKEISSLNDLEDSLQDFTEPKVSEVIIGTRNFEYSANLLLPGVLYSEQKPTQSSAKVCIKRLSI